jgi:hypothetical protein
MIDDKDFNGTLAGFQFYSDLLLQRKVNPAAMMIG